MDYYCILVELSRKSIAFSYYTDDIDKFEPYGDEPVKPLAVWFSGSSVIVGTDAKNEAQKGTTNAFYDLFELMERQEHFDYANEKHEYNKLILYTIRAGLKEFFIKVMKNTQGTLDENIAKLPLLLAIGNDVELNERNVLMNQLRDNGFGNAFEISEDKYIIRSFCKEEAVATQLSLILSINGENIYGTVYIGENSVDNFIYKNAGKDPRVDKLAKLVWERTMAENDWLDFEKEIHELRNASVKFIQSGDRESNDSITLSNGYEYSFYLTREDLNLYNQSDGGHITQEIVSRVIQHGEKQNCLVVLKGKAATNRYLQDLLLPEFPTLKTLDKMNKTKVMGRIVKWCKEQSFLFTHYNQKTPTVFVSEQMIAAPTKRDERNFKILALSIETSLHNGDVRSARREAEKFLREMHERHIDEFDARIEKLLFTDKSDNIQIDKPVNEPVQIVVSPSQRDNRNFKILHKSVEASVKNGDTDRMMSEIDAFLREMHGKSIYAFDEETKKMRLQLEEIGRSGKILKKTVPNNLSEGSHANVQPIPDPPIPVKPAFDQNISVVNKADALMKIEKYKEARELYRETNRQEQANDCTKLIKWTRLLSQYKIEVGATAQSHNVDKAQKRAKEMQEYIALYKKYGIKATELEVLQKEYKRIK